VANAKTDYRPLPKISLPNYNPTYKPNKKQLEKVVELIKSSQRPVIFAGGGVILAGAAKELTELARKAMIPVTTSLMGIGSFPGDDPLCLAMLGMHGTYRANMSIDACDVLLGIGVRFDDRVTGKIDTFAPNAKIVHIDIDPTSIRKNVRVTIPVVGDCKLALKQINRLLGQANMGNLPEKRKAWLDQIAYWKSTKPLAYKQEDTIKPQFVIEKLYELTSGKALITTEDKLVVDIAGDGSIQMNIQEMATAVQYCLPVKIVILNNGYLGMVRQWQELFYKKNYACTAMEHTPDFVKLAQSFGACGLRATRPDEVEDVLKAGLSEPRAAIMDFVVEKEESVYPMVPAGAPITEMLLV
jgi:acetolactate synthase-1/2/3 large subunit